MSTLRAIITMESPEVPEVDEDIGAGVGFGKLVLILTGVSALLACLLTLLYVFLIPHQHADEAK